MFPTKSLAFALGYFLFAIYLLSFSGKFHVMDELAVFTAAHNLAQHGRADINPLIWTNHWTPNPPGVWGKEGNLYTKKPPGISFITAPLIGLSQLIPGLNAVHVGLLTNVIVTALTASVLFLWLVDLGFSRATATLTTLGYGLCTFAWVYARMFWESSLLALTFLVAVWASYRAASLLPPFRGWSWLLLSGLAVAIGLTLRFEAALAVLFIGLYLVLSRWSGKSANQSLSRLPSSPIHFPPFVSRLMSHAPRLMFFLIPSLLIGLGLMYFNFIRFGSLGETGYTQEILFQEPWVGAFGLLFSPGRGLFIYAPLTLLLFWGVRPAWRRLPQSYFWLIAALCLSYWLFYGSWFAWGGTWGWGPRFLLPILPLLMVFVAEPIEEMRRRGGKEASYSTPEKFSPGLGDWGIKNKGKNPLISKSRPKMIDLYCASRFMFYALVALSLVVNFLGLAVDFNEHFLRLGSNDNFVFNWAAFPPLAHWRILQEGLVDLIWLQPHGQRLEMEWDVFIPPLILSMLATAHLVAVYRGKKGIRNVVLILLTLALTYLMLRGTARVGLANEQAKFDLPVLETLDVTARPGDVLLVPMPPFGDVQEISTRLMAYLDRPLPTFAWIESNPRAIQPTERELVWQAVQAEVRRVWLFERWLTQHDPPTPTAFQLNQMAFQIREQWFERSGKLTLYALADDSPAPTPLNVPFWGGLTLVDFAIVGAHPAPGGVLNLRLTWQAASAEKLARQQLPPDSIIVFAQLLHEKDGRQVAQIDRLLVDLQNFKQSPLLPGQTVQQGYGLQLPDNLPAGGYSLIIGLYQAGNGQRLPRADDSPDDFLYLTTVQVGS